MNDSSTARDRDPELNAARWDIEPLVDGDGEAGAERLLDAADRQAEAFAQRHAGAVADLDPPGLAAAMDELASISDLVGRAGSYAALHFSIDTADPARGALLARVQERSTAIETRLIFFELEWAKLDDARAEELLAGGQASSFNHHLRMARRYRPHLLSEPEEKLMSEKELTGAGAWGRLFSELVSALEVRVPDAEQPVPLDAALSRLMSPDRELRRIAAQAVTDALDPGLRTRAFIYNTLLQDKGIDDRLRRYPNWLAQRNLSNEASDESVQALIEAVRGRSELARRWYRLKARLLGIDKLADYDRMASLASEEETIDWRDARELVQDAYSAFSPQLGKLANRFFAERWIDAPPGPAKRGGAFCAYTVPSANPYVMLNFNARRRDALILAHELGHGLHAALAADQGIFHQHTPLTLAETASVFGETLVFSRLLEAAESPRSRLSLLAESIEGSIATVFRQVAMNRFEDAAHSARRGEGELSVARFGELWEQSQAELMGDAVQLTEGYRSWWSYVHHFVAVPGYVYAYAYGQLLALAVFHRYEEAGAAFVPDYLRLLAAGGSASPEELGGLVGVDLLDPGFWDTGLTLVERQLEAAERAAAEAGAA
ncbi:MAG: M3 family oligoendopeptidase [Solirubrobacteraceae bacterium]|nr:MAG: oligoendopeptidase [Solirubrobacterales bacterium]